VVYPYIISSLNFGLKQQLNLLGLDRSILFIIVILQKIAQFKMILENIVL